MASADEVVAPAPQVEAALGLFKGMSNGLLAIDLLGSAQLLPTNQIDNLSVDKDATSIGDVALGLGYGARVGVINQMGAIPGIAVSAMRRNIPEVTYGDVSQGNQYRYGVDLDATNLRAMAGYGFGIASIGGDWVGQIHREGRHRIQPDGGSDPIHFPRISTRSARWPSWMRASTSACSTWWVRWAGSSGRT